MPAASERGHRSAAEGRPGRARQRGRPETQLPRAPGEYCGRGGDASVVFLPLLAQQPPSALPPRPHPPLARRCHNHEDPPWPPDSVAAAASRYGPQQPLTAPLPPPPGAYPRDPGMARFAGARPVPRPAACAHAHARRAAGVSRAAPRPCMADAVASGGGGRGDGLTVLPPVVRVCAAV